MNKHTPGPWFYTYGAVYTDEEGTNRIGLADRDNTNTTPTERDSNCRLMAAAPDLLEVCKRAAAYFKTNKNTEKMIGPEYGIWHNLMEAIEKAEGRSYA